MGERRATLGLSPALPGIVLVIVIVWALAAVLMLSGTLVNAREIDSTVPIIQNEVSPIDKDLDNVKLAAETAKISAGILKAAKPLSGQADRIISAASNIDGRVAQINETAKSINSTAKSINGNVTSINATVSSINGKVVSINRTVDGIQANALGINRTVDSIDSSVETINTRVTSVFDLVGPVGATDNDSIKGSVTNILTSFRGIDPETRSIEPGVAAINGRASKGIDGVRSLKDDLGPVRTIVGPGGPPYSTAGPGNIDGHANSIDCAPLINSLGNTQNCNR